MRSTPASRIGSMCVYPCIVRAPPPEGAPRQRPPEALRIRVRVVWVYNFGVFIVYSVSPTSLNKVLALLQKIYCVWYYVGNFPSIYGKLGFIGGEIREYNDVWHREHKSSAFVF